VIVLEAQWRGEFQLAAIDADGEIRGRERGRVRVGGGGVGARLQARVERGSEIAREIEARGAEEGLGDRGGDVGESGGPRDRAGKPTGGRALVVEQAADDEIDPEDARGPKREQQPTAAAVSC